MIYNGVHFDCTIDAKHVHGASDTEEDYFIAKNERLIPYYL